METAPSPYNGGDNTTGPPADHAFLPFALLDIDDELEVDVELVRASPYSTPPSFVNDSRDTSPFPWNEAPGANTDVEDDDLTHAPPHFFPISQRLPSRAGAPRAPVPALAATIDPRGHRQAMKAPEAAEWQAAELAELQNHTANGSFREMNRGDARRLANAHGVDFNVTGSLWVYKTKRDDRRKARLCLNGASQQEGVDYDQTYSSTLRHSSQKPDTASWRASLAKVRGREGANCVPTPWLDCVGVGGDWMRVGCCVLGRAAGRRAPTMGVSAVVNLCKTFMKCSSVYLSFCFIRISASLLHIILLLLLYISRCVCSCS